MTYGMGFDVEQDYFHWLCELVHVDQVNVSYWILAKDLYHKEFYPVIERDENRADDGLELREEYLREVGYPKYIDIPGPCNVLEMLVALARRMDFETTNPYDLDDADRTSYWFWEMIDNLGLTRFSDDAYVELEGQIYVDWILDNFMKRNYEPNGFGGLFPLRKTKENQTNVEIWYQMCAYLYERESVV